jgi:tetratricopeptide (TPR) repeat protein
MVWNRYEVADVESLYVQGAYAPALALVTPVWHFGVLVPLAAVGWISTWPQRRRLWVYGVMTVAMAAAVTAFFVLARYRYPLVPLLLPFAAAGVVDLWGALRQRRIRALLAWAGVGAAVALFANWPIHPQRQLDALAQMNVGVVLARANEIETATPFLEAAVEMHPDSAEANNNLAQALAMRGHFERAITHYRRALDAAPSLIGVHFNLAVALERVELIHEAIHHYEQAVAERPDDREAKAALARLRDR